MAIPADPTATAFLLAESRRMPLHVGGLELFRPPADAGPDFPRELYEAMRGAEEIAPLFLRHPHRSAATGGAYVWRPDRHFDIDYHVRHSALPAPGRILELLALCSRLHGTRLARERPLWEAHVIEGLADGRVAVYTKVHHALVDGVSAMRLLQGVLSTDPDERGMQPPWAAHPPAAGRRGGGAVAPWEVPVTAVRQALAISADAAGLPGALVRTIRRSVRGEPSSLSLSAPRSILNQRITAARRFAAQDWELDRLHAIGTATGTTINDVVLAMCSGALRTYLRDNGGLPVEPLIAMVPVGLKSDEVNSASTSGGNAVGAVMVRLATDLDDPSDRLQAIHRSMLDGKEGLGAMSPLQIVAMSGLGLAPAVVLPALRLNGILPPPFNLIISNVPGPRDPLYFNGAELVGMYPLSIPIDGMALNITCTTYAGSIGFGLTGCRRTAPSLQHLLTYLDDELQALEAACLSS
ncbi:WS/DGAT/MGAT family O-acyltransferase [Nocardioides massiliensis]|uniref:Diacylglycerol O-acyltransferase n=1 Tax=Nocardioides massiliensis TaxID=1325935 RepID=A0ABT9NSS3_9ACTN|nr:wax ester/triacylglycerol synthase family O-acyltransferase [Nocardioides massiliensis]MDP9823366.1 diacylglycerol O-acyltransferase [Nocardioides massiliensis]